MTGELRERVTGSLKKGCPPEQIAGRLCFERNRGETDMSVSREIIYTWVYAQQKGGLASGEIILCTGREQRQPRGR
jgi:IS30 family transposase